MLGLVGFSGSLPCTLFIDIISLFINWANKDACLLACLRINLFNFQYQERRGQFWRFDLHLNTEWGLKRFSLRGLRCFACMYGLCSWLAPYSHYRPRFAQWRRHVEHVPLLEYFFFKCRDKETACTRNWLHSYSDRLQLHRLKRVSWRYYIVYVMA